MSLDVNYDYCEPGYIKHLMTMYPVSDGDDLLLNCVKTNNKSLLKKLIDCGYNVNKVYTNYLGPHKYETTLLIEAVFMNNVDIVDLLLASNVNVNEIIIDLHPKFVKLYSEYTLYDIDALKIAILNGSTEISLKLIDQGSNVNRKINSNETYLMHCCKLGYKTIADVLIDFGAKVDETNGIIYRTKAADYAIKNGYIALYDKLVNKEKEKT